SVPQGPRASSSLAPCSGLGSWRCDRRVPSATPFVGEGAEPASRDSDEGSAKLEDSCRDLTVARADGLAQALKGDGGSEFEADPHGLALSSDHPSFDNRLDVRLVTVVQIETALAVRTCTVPSRHRWLSKHPNR